MSTPESEVHEDVAKNIDGISARLRNQGLGALSEAYEQYQKEIAKAEAMAYKGEAGDVVMEKIKDLEALFQHLTKNDSKDLPMFMRDSEALKRTAQFASINAQHIKLGDFKDKLSQKELTNAIKKFMNPDHDFSAPAPNPRVDHEQSVANETFNSFNWLKLGHLALKYSKAPVPSLFLYGPLATERRRVATRTRTVDDTLGNRGKTTAQTVSVDDIHHDPEQSTSHMVRSIYKTLIEACGDDENDALGMNLFRFFINPHLFAQSVENLFYTSFLVRDGKLRICADANGVPEVHIPDQDDDFDDSASVVHQIATFDYPTWQRLIADYNITELFIPHRDVEEDVFDDDENDENEANSGGEDED